LAIRVRAVNRLSTTIRVACAVTEYCTVNHQLHTFHAVVTKYTTIANNYAATAATTEAAAVQTHKLSDELNERSEIIL
jgi:hypothetical protein